jgi:hypothetical protein
MIVVLFALIATAAVAQLVIASRDGGPLRGPVSGTPLPPELTATPSP